MKGCTMRPFLIFALTFVFSGAHAQTMFKCVDGNGKTSYSDQPCSGKVVAKKEIDVRANLDDAERENRKKAEKLERAREEEMYRSQDQEMANSAQAKKMERQIKLMEGSELDRRLSIYEQMKADTAIRVKADEEARAEASRLWKCKRGPAPEKCI
jgi:hypothetical protein